VTDLATNFWSGAAVTVVAAAVTANAALAILSFQPLGDAEVEELRLPLLRHQDVARLQVAMDQQVLVRILDRAADPPKKIQAPVDRQPVQLAVAVDGQAFHQLHDEVWATLRRGAAVVEAGNVGVLQPSEDLPLAEELEAGFRRVQAPAQHLDRHQPLILLVVPLPQVNRAHAAAAETAHQPVGADSPGFLCWRHQPHELAGWTLEKGTDLGVGSQELLHLALEVGITGTGGVQNLRALDRGRSSIAAKILSTSLQRTASIQACPSTGCSWS